MMASELNTVPHLNEESKDDLCSILWNQLKNSQFDDALSEIKKENHKSFLTYNSLDIIPIITKILDEEHQNDCETCVEEILVHVASIANIKEALLVFLEEIELAKSRNKFRLILRPMQTLLVRQISRETKSANFAWTFNTIYAYISQLQLPENLNLEMKEIILLDCDTNVQEITDILQWVVEFYEIFYKKIMEKELIFVSKDTGTESYFACYLLQLLHHPLSYLYVVKCENISDSALYRICENIVSMVTNLVHNPFKLFDKMTLTLSIKEEDDDGDEDKSSIKSDSDEDKSSIKNEIEDKPKDYVSNLSLANYFYCILQQNMSDDMLPCVYSSQYKFFNCLILINCLLEHKVYATLHKGVYLAETLVKNLEDFSLTGSSLEVYGHSQFPHSLIKIMVFCENENLRKACLKIFRSYLQKFDMKGRYKLLLSLLNTCKHPGVFGLVVHEIKQNIDINYKNNEMFSGENLKRLVKLSCKLPEEELTDLLEWSDKIMAALNLLLFISIRNQSFDLVPKDLFSFIENYFIAHLQRGIDLSREHYKLELTQLKSRSKKIESSVETSVMVGGVHLPSLPPNQKVNVINSALSSLDMMQCVLSQVKGYISQS